MAGFDYNGFVCEIRVTFTSTIGSARQIFLLSQADASQRSRGPTCLVQFMVAFTLL